MFYPHYSRIHWICLIFAAVTLSVFGHNHDNGLSISPKQEAYVLYVNTTYHVLCLTPKSTLNSTTWKGPSGERLPENKGRIHTTVRQGSDIHGVGLYFESIEKKDRGIYTCSSVIGGKDVKVNFNLIVIKPISFLDTPNRQNATVHTDALVRCEVDGEPTPTIVWHVNGKKLNESNKKYSIVADGLIIKNVSLSDKGEYECRAFQTSQMISNVEEQRIALTVQYKPTWKYPERKGGYYGYLSGVVNLTCEASADPSPVYEWFIKNKQLKSRSDATIYTDSEMSVLQLLVTDESVFTVYTCNASNRLGFIKRHFKLQKGQKPAPPALVDFHNILVEAVELDIKRPEDKSDILGFQIQYMKTNHKEDKKWEIAHSIDLDIIKGQGTWYKVSDLDIDTSYLLRVATRNVAGISDYSPVLSFRTLKHSNADTVTSNTEPMLAAFPFSVIVPLIRIVITQFL